MGQVCAKSMGQQQWGPIELEQHHAPKRVQRRRPTLGRHSSGFLRHPSIHTSRAKLELGDN